MALGLLMGGFHGMRLWTALGDPTQMAIPWNGIGASHGWIPWNASMVLYVQLMGITPNGHSMEWPWHLSLGMPWNASRLISCGPTNGNSMEWHWDFSWVDSMACFYGQLLGIPPKWPFHGMALGLLMAGFHGMPLWVAHGDRPMVLSV